MTVALTPEVVAERVQLVLRAVEQGDYENAHAIERELLVDVVRHFSATGDSVAVATLRSLDIQFERRFG